MHSVRRTRWIAAAGLATAAHAQPETLACGPWSALPTPVWEGLLMAGDPSVIRTPDGTYFMHFTGFMPEPDRATIGVATSPDGVTWDWAGPTTFEEPFVFALDGRPGEWDEQLETVAVIERGTDASPEYWMYYTGYVVDESRFVSPYEIGLAKSTDGITFTRASNDPVLRLEPPGINDAPTNDFAMTSPGVVEHDGALYMVFLAWGGDANGTPDFFELRGAFSTDPEGLVWQRHPDPVLPFPIAGLPEIDGAVEPGLLKGSDGRFYLFITADDAENPTSPSSIAVLTSCHPFGPWTSCGDLAVEMTQPWHDDEIIAPHAIEDDGLLRLYYHGLTFNDALTGERFRVGYAEAPFTPGPSPDTNGDGQLSPNDFNAWILAFNSQSAACDQNGDGRCTPGDFNAWVLNYNAGC
ncbi:MAG: GC-type dockerin domain-anchored protein [Planctomycetota bacterium]